MNWDYMSPYIRYAADGYVYNSYKIIDRIIFDYELLYVKEGNIIVEVGDKKYNGVPGDIFFLRPNETHSIIFITNPYVRQPHVHFDLVYQEDSVDTPINFRPLAQLTELEKLKIRKDITKGFPLDIPTYIKLDNPINFEKLLLELINEVEKQLPFYELQAKSLFLEMFTYLIREIFWKENTKNHISFKLINNVKEYLVHNTSTAITLDDLSQLFNISKCHLIKIFNKNFSESPIHFHIKKRIGAAKLLLQFTDLSITEIAAKTGFKAIHTFSRTFKQIENISPLQYRNSVK